MTPAERGKRIKEARLAKKMTQSEVVGSFITRNMLSQIESGTATPSVKTLEYLADVLDIQISALMPGNDECDSNSFLSPVLSRFLSAKEFFIGKDYEACVSELTKADSPGALNDEFSALYTLAYYNLAIQSAENSNLIKAVEYAKLSSEYAELGIYKNEYLKSNAVLLKNEYAKKLSSYYAALVSE